ncbi:MAG: hypothetical protein AABZ00_12110 [Chloroflexota bacterium]
MAGLRTPSKNGLRTSVRIAGEIAWIGLYGGLGYLFRSQWELVSDFISIFGGLVLGVVIFIIGIRQA